MDTAWRFATWAAENAAVLMNALGLIGLLAGATNRWAVANRRDSLASMTGAAGRMAGTMATMLAETPVGMKPADFAMAVLRRQAEAMIREFDKTAPIIGATPDKLAAMAMGELGKIMGPEAASLQVPVRDAMPTRLDIAR